MSTPRRASGVEQWRRRYGSWAVVTGASSGIGRAIAVELGRRGLSLVLSSRRREPLEDLATTLASNHGCDTRIFTSDMADPEGPAGLLRSTADVDVGLLVAAAGFGTSGPMLANRLETEEDMVRVNCLAPLSLVSGFGGRFAERGTGGVVLLSSIVAFQGVARAANYAATKAYIQTLAEGLRGEWGPLGVDVLAAAPGPVNSGFAERAGMDLGRALDPDAIAPEILDALGRRGTVRPGWLTKVLSAALTVPRWARVLIMRQVMGGMTRHQSPATRLRPEGRAS
jgi:short-subunit dehydrogenase